jgi:hypothetical protein
MGSCLYGIDPRAAATDLTIIGPNAVGIILCAIRFLDIIPNLSLASGLWGHEHPLWGLNNPLVRILLDLNLTQKSESNLKI